MTTHAYQNMLGGDFIYRDRAGRTAPVIARIVAEFQQLRAQCAADGLPDRHYGEAIWFVRDVVRDHCGRFNAWDDPTLTLAFKDASKGLTPGNIVISHLNDDGK